MTEPNYEPENRSKCDSNDGLHQWVWDEDIDDYYCDECGVHHENQED